MGLIRNWAESARCRSVQHWNIAQTLGLSLAVAIALISNSQAAERPRPRPEAGVNATTLDRKVLCGYQGWFRCPEDSARMGWRHWSRDPARIGPNTSIFEMWPDMSEYDATERYPAQGFVNPDGTPAHLFSSTHPRTVERHFEWMRQYGIDGVFLQRFVSELKDPSMNKVLDNVRRSAEQTGRAYAICYDLTGTPNDKVLELVAADWRRLVEVEKITRDGRYLHHNGKPVVFVWGFFADRFGPVLANRLIDFFKADPRHAATLIGGCEWWWRTEKDREWGTAFRRFDFISPWNVGNCVIEDKHKHASTATWKDDHKEAAKSGMGFIPVIYPGFGWTNLKGESAAKDNIPRLGGEFFWRQFSTAAELGISMAYVAMFDEVDEGTAIFKVSNAPPRPGHFATYDGLPSDWYLRLTGEGTRLLRGERHNQKSIPIKP